MHPAPPQVSRVMNKISRLRNPVQKYAWGSKTAIQELLGEPGTSEDPVAELWMGAHPRAPSSVLTSGNWEPLDQVIERDPESVLGRGVAERFHGRLPFLFKVLAAEKPLSIQVHPDIRSAREGFLRENRLQIPLDAPDRNYKDDNHKPEVLCALTPFQCLKGFREISEILDVLETLSSPILHDEIRRCLKKKPAAIRLKSLFSGLMTMEKGLQKALIADVARDCQRSAGKDPVRHCIRVLNRAYPGDIGVLAPAFLNLLTLDPGEAVFLPPRTPHAYLKGVGIELMANSDNVLRGGLTQKHMDIPELLRVIDFRNDTVDRIQPQIREAGEVAFPTPAEEFILSVIRLNNRTMFASSERESADILICLEGKGTLDDLSGSDRLPVQKGQSVLVPAAVSQYCIMGDVTLYKASVPT